MGDIDFKVICAPENSNKFQKTRFWKEKSVEDVVTGNTWANGTGNTSITCVTLLTTNLQLITLVFFGACVHNPLV